jgi:hypothetical protein
VALLGFPHDLEPRDIARFLIEQGIAILRNDQGWRMTSAGGVGVDGVAAGGGYPYHRRGWYGYPYRS